MDDRHAPLDPSTAQALLGYLNFSDGRPDPRWQKQLNDAFAAQAAAGAARPWDALLAALGEALSALEAGGGAAFRDASQARAALALAAETLPAYRRHHADLLAHLDDAELFAPFFLARVFEACLQLLRHQRRSRRRPTRRRPAQRLRRPPAHRHAGDPAAGRALRARAAPPRAAVPARRGRRRRAATSAVVERTLEILRGTDAGPPRRGVVRPRPARRDRPRPARLRPRPPGQPPAQLRLRRVGPAPHRQPGPLLAATSSARSRSTPSWTASRQPCRSTRPSA